MIYIYVLVGWEALYLILWWGLLLNMHWLFILHLNLERSHQVIEYICTSGSTCRWGTAYPLGAHEVTMVSYCSIHVFCVILQNTILPLTTIGIHYQDKENETETHWLMQMNSKNIFEYQCILQYIYIYIRMRDERKIPMW